MKEIGKFMIRVIFKSLIMLSGVVVCVCFYQLIDQKIRDIKAEKNYNKAMIELKSLPSRVRSINKDTVCYDTNYQKSIKK